MFRPVFISALLAALAMPTLTVAQSERDHRLKGRIIRALAVHADDVSHILVGQKAKAPGSGLVFRSIDGGQNWRTQNGATALSPAATDVQAVVALSPSVLLAGTWKNGLYVSRDGGKRFQRVENFPSEDIRDLQVHSGMIYAATARHGIFVSRDQAKTWQGLGPNSDFFWSITVHNGDLYASSLETGVFHRHNGKWHRIFKADKASGFAAASHRRAIAGQNGVYISERGPWRQTLKGENIADVLMPDNDTILAASWDNGIAVLAPGGRVKKRLLKGKAVIHLQISGTRLLAGTWGDGLHFIPLSEVIDKRPPLIDAVLKNDQAAVKKILASGANPDSVDQNRNTALIFAARDGQLDMAKALIAAGASPGWVDGEAVTPLILAAFRNHINIVKLLLAQGVDKSHKDKWSRSALDYAKRRGEEDPIYLLLKK